MENTESRPTNVKHCQYYKEMIKILGFRETVFSIFFFEELKKLEMWCVKCVKQQKKYMEL